MFMERVASTVAGLVLLVFLMVLMAGRPALAATELHGADSSFRTGGITILWAILKGTFLTAVGIGCLAAALVGHVWIPLGWLQRLFFIAAASLLVFPTIGYELLGIGLALALFAWAKVKKVPRASP